MALSGSRTAPTLIGLWLTCVLSASAQNPRQTRQEPANLPDVNPYASAADITIGRAIYNGRCGHCHGLSGEGGRGAVLNAGRFRLMVSFTAATALGLISERHRELHSPSASKVNPMKAGPLQNS